jgi:hypothetical protein
MTKELESLIRTLDESDDVGCGCVVAFMVIAAAVAFAIVEISVAIAQKIL